MIDTIDIDDDDDGILDVNEDGPEIINPSFELDGNGDPITGTGYVLTTPDLLGWTVIQGNVDAWQIGTQTDGDRALDINGTMQGGVEQSVGTIAGQSYDLMLDYRPGGQRATVNIIDDATGDVLETFVAEGTSTSFETATVSFTAEGSTTIQIISDSGTAGGVNFDNFRFNNDPDNDGIINSLDTDSDNGGVSDNEEAQYGQEYVAPLQDDEGNPLDIDGDGLNDAYDDNTNGAEGSVGLEPVDLDGDGIMDAYQDGELPLTIDEAMTSGLSGTGLPGATITISVGETILGTAEADDDGNWSFDIAEADPLTVGEGDELTATQTHPDYPDAEGVATAEALLDTDFDGVADSVDIDDDNDGIIDVNDGDWVPVNFTGIDDVTTVQSFGSIDVGGNPVSITGQLLQIAPVSYTHLTLPTNREV